MLEHAIERRLRRSRFAVMRRSGSPVQPSLGRLAASLLLLISALGASGAYAQNVVQNANFQSDLTAWTQYLSAAPDPVGAGAAPSWVAAPDINGGGSGSALLDITTSPTQNDATNAASGISQCIDFHNSPVAVHFVDYGMSFLVPATTADDGSINATVEIRLFADADCANFITGGSQGRTIITGLASDSTWYLASDDNFLPPTDGVMVASAEIRGMLRETGAALAQLDYQLNVDKFFLRFNTTTPVRLMDFRVD